MYLTYYLHLFGIKIGTRLKNALSWKLQNNVSSWSGILDHVIVVNRVKTFRFC
jgi:hypothetical protein